MTSASLGTEPIVQGLMLLTNPTSLVEHAECRESVNHCCLMHNVHLLFVMVLKSEGKCPTATSPRPNSFPNG